MRARPRRGRGGAGVPPPSHGGALLSSGDASTRTAAGGQRRGRRGQEETRGDGCGDPSPPRDRPPPSEAAAGNKERGAGSWERERPCHAPGEAAAGRSTPGVVASVDVGERRRGCDAAGRKGATAAAGRGRERRPRPGCRGAAAAGSVRGRERDQGLVSPSTTGDELVGDVAKGEPKASPRSEREPLVRRLRASPSEVQKGDGRGPDPQGGRCRPIVVIPSSEGQRRDSRHPQGPSR